MVSYIVIGIIWCLFLEYYTTTYIPGTVWSMRERAFNALLWPVSLFIFIYTFIKSINDKED